MFNLIYRQNAHKKAYVIENRQAVQMYQNSILRTSEISESVVTLLWQIGELKTAY